MMYVILIGAVLVFWLVAVDRPVLKIKFNDGAIEQVKGHLPPSFKHNLQEIGHNNAFKGELKVYAKRSGYNLKFTKGVPKNVQQRIRNVFPHNGFKSKGSKKA
ncbi:conserved hypothetical protein [Vibrio chagasii]|uniref:DUF3634 family protein n=1 Tax=Vibrio chagasii TaxID=170679 RepID=UPI003371727B|nr:conserved hypothetical protein [Vibrio chagasii]CAH7030179.1 conserved hypothetical protein [Vibrio chagasii]